MSEQMTKTASKKVELKSVSKSYGKTATIKELDLTINNGEFMVLVGPSGCGKSTILRMIAGLEEITKGEIFIGDKVVNKVHPKDRDIAMVFQNYALYPHMSVYENMAFGLKMRKFDKATIDERVNKAAKILNLTEYLDRKPKQLSGGQRQRVALGRAIVREPAVFLMDEPLSNLDAKLRVQMRSEIKKLHKELSTTFIYVTHDQVEAMTMGDRIAVINNGELQQTDAPENIYNNPQNTFVAGFIGSPSMNFVEAKITDDGLLLIDGIDFPLSESNNKIAEKNLLKGHKVIAGIRPEHFSVVQDEDKSLKIKPDFVEMLGGEKIIHFGLAGKSLSAKVSFDLDIKPLEDLKLTFDMSKVLLFNPENQRIFSL